MLLGEERLKESLISIIFDFNKKGLSIGTIYYVLKDVLNLIEQNYFEYVEQNRDKVKQEIEKEFQNAFNVVEQIEIPLEQQQEEKGEEKDDNA